MPAQSRMTFAEVASTTKHFRLPTQVGDQIAPIFDVKPFPATIPILPTVLGTNGQGPAPAFYAIRLNEHYTSAEAFLFGERKYVTTAYMASAQSVVVVDDQSKHSLIIFDMRSRPPATGTRPFLTFVPYWGKSLTVNIPNLDKEVHLAIFPQTINLIASLKENGLAHLAQLEKNFVAPRFSKYTVLVLKRDDLKAKTELEQAQQKKLLFAMKLELLQSNPHPDEMLQMTFESESTRTTCAQLFAASGKTRGIALKGTNYLRIRSKKRITKEVFDEYVKTYGAHCRTMITEDGNHAWKKPAAKTMVLFKRVDHSIITEEVADALAKHFNLERHTLRDGCLFGTTPKCHELHRACISGIFTVLWLAAEDMKNAEDMKTDLSPEVAGGNQRTTTHVAECDGDIS